MKIQKNKKIAIVGILLIIAASVVYFYPSLGLIGEGETTTLFPDGNTPEIAFTPFPITYAKCKTHQFKKG